MSASNCWTCFLLRGIFSNSLPFQFELEPLVLLARQYYSCRTVTIKTKFIKTIKKCCYICAASLLEVIFFFIAHDCFGGQLCAEHFVTVL